MATITVHSILMNAVSRLPNCRERRLLEGVAERMDYRLPSYPNNFMEVGATVVEFDPDDSAAQIGPICPHCKREPCQVQANPLQFGPIPVMQFTCSGCRKIIGMAALPPFPMQPEREQSSLILPRM